MIGIDVNEFIKPPYMTFKNCTAWNCLTQEVDVSHRVERNQLFIDLKVCSSMGKYYQVAFPVVLWPNS